jgi:hypothetical protein
VGIGTVVQPRVPVRLPLVATIVLLVVALLAALAGPRDPAGSGDALATIAIAGQPAGGDEPVVTSLTDPLGIAGLPVTATELSLDVVTAGLTLATATAPVTGGVAEIDLGLRGWLVGGVTEGRLVISEAGAESSAATVILATEQPWWQSGIGAAAIVLALFALAAVESQSRRHDRGRVRMANAIGAAIGAGVVAACGTVVLTLATDRVIALSGWLTPAVLAAAAGCSLTVTRARLARRRRLTWRG